MEKIILFIIKTLIKISTYGMNKRYDLTFVTYSVYLSLKKTPFYLYFPILVLLLITSPIVIFYFFLIKKSATPFSLKH